MFASALLYKLLLPGYSIAGSKDVVPKTGVLRIIKKGRGIFLGFLNVEKFSRFWVINRSFNMFFIREMCSTVRSGLLNNRNFGFTHQLITRALRQDSLWELDSFVCIPSFPLIGWSLVLYRISKWRVQRVQFHKMASVSINFLFIFITSTRSILILYGLRPRSDTVQN